MDESVFSEAVRAWWQHRTANAAGIKRAQGGSRDESLRGNTMDGFRDTIVDALLEVGVDEADIYVGGPQAIRASNLPSYFRATKNWDVVVCKNATSQRHAQSRVSPRLIAAMEFKSQKSSIGNNQNNRIEESIGNATDFWASYEHGNFESVVPRPWLGYLFVGVYTDDDVSNPVQVNQPLIPSDPIFLLDQEAEGRLVDGVSYSERYRLFLERAIGKQLYDRACLVITSEDILDQPTPYRTLCPALSGSAFLDGLCRHVRAYYFD